jgi:hypothetical protein
MPALRNQKHEAFARNIFRSPKTGWSAKRCYEESGYRTSGHGSEVNASKLLRTTEVKMRVDELARPAVRKAQVSIEALLSQLDAVISDARADRQHGAAIAGYGLIVKICAMLHERADNTEFAGNLTSDQIFDLMLQEVGPDQLVELADDLKRRALLAAGDRATPVKEKRKASAKRKRPKPATD